MNPTLSDESSFIPSSINNQQTSDNNITTNKIINKQKKVLVVAKEKEIHLKRIVEADKVENADSILSTTPAIKPIITRPEVQFTHFMYVKVSSDFSPVNIRSVGYGYIKRIYVEGLLRVSDVKYSPEHDGGRLHNKYLYQK